MLLQRLSLLFLLSFCASIADTSQEAASGKTATPHAAPFFPSRLVRTRRPIVGDLRGGGENARGPSLAMAEMRGGGEDDFRVTEEMEADKVPKVRDAVLKMWEVEQRESALAEADAGFEASAGRIQELPRMSQDEAAQVLRAEQSAQEARQGAGGRPARKDPPGARPTPQASRGEERGGAPGRGAPPQGARKGEVGVEDVSGGAATKRD
ncbi:hypothetical protein T484DRAFT_1907828, partial [Baffinella frigidus]